MLSDKKEKSKDLGDKLNRLLLEKRGFKVSNVNPNYMEKGEGNEKEVYRLRKKHPIDSRLDEYEKI